MNNRKRNCLGLFGLAVFSVAFLAFCNTSLAGNLKAISPNKFTNPVIKRVYPSIDKMPIIKLNNFVDTLVIVNTDVYNITDNDIQRVFKIANELWLYPKTGINFRTMDIEHLSFKELQNNGYGNIKYYLRNNYFRRMNGVYPEYVVVFDLTEITGRSGGVCWAIGTDSFLSTLKERENFCSEFPSAFDDRYYKTIPSATIDYGSKFARCGYDTIGSEIISEVSINNGECKNTADLQCIIKNGYQMCPNALDHFHANDPLSMTASIIVHEFLHLFGVKGSSDHLSSACKEELGWSNEYMSEAGPPFNSWSVEYAGICPTLWNNFLDSQSVCERCPGSMAFIPNGKFKMGSEDDIFVDVSSPVHQVTLTKEFCMDKYEFINREKDEFQSSNPVLTGEDGGALTWPPNFQLTGVYTGHKPLVNVSWYQANAICKLQGKRLCTEAEWEYGARGGKDDCLYGTKDCNTPSSENVCWGTNNPNIDTICDSGSKPPNAFGLYDMSGNVSEWVSDWYGVYNAENKSDPKGPVTEIVDCTTYPIACGKVIRGGSYYSISLTSPSYKSQRTEYRFGKELSTTTHTLGFRCCVDAMPKVQ